MVSASDPSSSRRPEWLATPSQSPGPSGNASGSSFKALAGGLTPLSAERASQHLAGAYQNVTGQAPSPETLSLLWAQWALETSRGQAMYGNNFGGIKAGAGQQGALLSTTEGYGEGARRIRDRFRTYGTPEQGARDYVAMLARRFPEAFEGLKAGNVETFAQGLHRGRYFTAHPETYRRGLERLASEHQSGAPLPLASDHPFQALALEGLRWALERAMKNDE